MTRFLAAGLLLLCVESWAESCWMAIEPSAFAYECPIIVAGTIESVVQAAPGGLRSDDVANIRIAAVHRNELTDVALKNGDLLAVKMISSNNRQRTSTDLNYPADSKAVWIIVLTSKGEYRIDLHPVQKQPFHVAPLAALRRMDAVETRRKIGDPPSKLANPAGSKTKAEWIAWKRANEQRQVDERTASLAQQKAIRELAQAFADAETLNEALWKRFQGSDVEIRRSILLLSLNEQPMTGTRFAEVSEGVLLREKDDNVRTHAVAQLAYCRDPGVKGMEVLTVALRDPSPSVRMFACQSVKLRRYEKLMDRVKELQNDPDRQVREMAMDTIAFWREKAK